MAQKNQARASGQSATFLLLLGRHLRAALKRARAVRERAPATGRTRAILAVQLLEAARVHAQ